MLVDVVKAMLWGMALLVHCLTLLLLLPSVEWGGYIIGLWWTEGLLPEYDYKIIPQAASILEQIKEPERLIESNQRPGEATKEASDRHKAEMNAKIRQLIQNCEGCGLWYADETDLYRVRERLEILASRDTIASYRRWLAVWRVCKVAINIIAAFLLLTLVRARWLGAVPYLSFVVILVPIAVLLNIPYYVVMHHEVANHAWVWESFIYWILGAVIVIFVGWPPLLIVLGKSRRPMRRMALAVLIGGAFQETSFVVPNDDEKRRTPEATR